MNLAGAETSCHTLPVAVSLVAIPGRTGFLSVYVESHGMSLTGERSEFSDD